MEPADQIEITYTPRFLDYLLAHYMVIRLRAIDIAWRVVFTLFFVLAAVYCVSVGHPLYAAIFMVLCGYVVFRAEARLITGFVLDPRFRQPITIRFSEHGVQHIAQHHNYLRWDYFQRWQENDRVFVMLMGRSASIVIPKQQVSKDTMQRIAQMVKDKLKTFPAIISVNGALLAKESGEYSIKYVDASWYMPQEGRDARMEFESEHIEGAVFFDIDAVRDMQTSLPHMLPSAQDFAQEVGRLGISNEDTVIVYDGSGLFSAARVWWMFRLFGHKKVAVLDGGLPRWKQMGLKVSAEAEEPEAVEYKAVFNPQHVRGLQQIVSNLPLREEQVLDARSPGRFSGEEAEPRPGLASGHIPHSVNVHYKQVLNEDGTMKSSAELKELFTSAGVDFDKPLVASCGSGVTACILVLALETIGKRDVSVYDGSWAEWGASGQPVETCERVA